MTFKEAVEKMRSMNHLGYRTVEYAHQFIEPDRHEPDRREEVDCKLYTRLHGGVHVTGKTWEEAFAHFIDRINKAPLSDKGAPGEEEPGGGEDETRCIN